MKKEVAELAEKVVDGHARLGVEIDAAEDMLEKIDAVEKEIGEHEAAVLEERAANVGCRLERMALSASG